MYTAKEARVALAKSQLRAIDPYIGGSIDQAIEDGENKAIVALDDDVDYSLIIDHLHALGYIATILPDSRTQEGYKTLQIRVTW